MTEAEGNRSVLASGRESAHIQRRWYRHWANLAAGWLRMCANVSGSSSDRVVAAMIASSYRRSWGDVEVDTLRSRAAGWGLGERELATSVERHVLAGRLLIVEDGCRVRMAFPSEQEGLQ